MSKTTVQPYLFFGGRCDEALEFYGAAVGAKVDFKMRFDESPEPLPPGRLQAGFENKVMHCSFHIGSTVLMASDGCEAKSANYEGFALAYSAADDTEARKAFEALAHGGAVTMPLSKTFWSSLFGMLTDKFGINWMVSVEH